MCVLQDTEGSTHQLRSHAVCGLEGALVQEVVIGPALVLAVGLPGVVHIEQRQMVACAAAASAASAVAPLQMLITRYSTQHTRQASPIAA